MPLCIKILFFAILVRTNLTDVAITLTLERLDWPRELRNDSARPGEERNAVSVDKKGMPLRTSGGAEFLAPYIHFGV